MGSVTAFGGKPKNDQVIPGDGKWYLLDMDVADPAKSGLEIQEMYVHLDCAWREPDGAIWGLVAASFLAPVMNKLKWLFTPAGEVRVRYTRESGDHTAYQDFTVASRKKDFLISHNHSEKGQAGQGGRWWIQVEGGLAGVTATTRYSKNGVAF